MQQRPREVPGASGASGDNTTAAGYLLIRTVRPRTDPWEAGDVVEVIDDGMKVTATTTLTDFLLARIADDEAVALETPTNPTTEMTSGGASCRLLVSSPSATRNVGIVALGICLACDVEQQPCDHRVETLRLLALPYAGHADYRDEWRQ